MAQFYPLSVSDIRKETRDAVVVTLSPRAEDADAFRFTQGQYLTFRRNFDGQEVRRCYSICASPDDGTLRVGIKKVEDGCFSSWANENLQAGDTLEAMAPMGNFHTVLEPEKRKSYLGFAGGSGITPLISIVRTVLEREPGADFTLVYGNRSINAIMFREELEDLKDNYLGRFTLIHILESESQEIDLFAGRLDREKCDLLFSSWVQVEKADQAFICGPEPMMLAVRDSLKAHGLGEDRIKIELFSGSQMGRVALKQRSGAEATKGKTCRATITVDGATRVVDMPAEGQSILEAALEAGLGAPYSCTAGVCSTCRAQVTEGPSEMAANHALEDYEVRDGYVLTCQCYPTGDSITVTYDT